MKETGINIGIMVIMYLFFIAVSFVISLFVLRFMYRFITKPKKEKTPCVYCASNDIKFYHENSPERKEFDAMFCPICKRKLYKF